MSGVVTGIMLILLLIGTLILSLNIQPARANGTIYIKVDGSVEPPTALIQRNGDIYTLIGDIVSDADGIIVERDNMTLDGASHTLHGTEEGWGVDLEYTQNVTIKNMKIKSFRTALELGSSSNNYIIGNEITLEYGMALSDCGISLRSSSGNTVSGNNIANRYYGVRLDSSVGNTVVGNNITADGYGVYLNYSDANTVSGNNIANNNRGIYLDSSVGNTVSGNNIANNYGAVHLLLSSRNTISGNNITADNQFGVYLALSSDNTFCHNNLVDNVQQVYSVESTNAWDDGYPNGGNYWSDYDGTDLLRGSDQNETGSDGIGDYPYTIDHNNTDRYPLIHPYTPIHGDINHDRTVDIYDAIILASAFNSTPSSSNWNPNADFNNDNVVDIYDAITLANNFGKTA